MSNLGNVQCGSSAVGSVELPIVFATCGWQFEEVDPKDAKFSGLFSLPVKEGLGKSVVVSTDGGKVGTDPRVYQVYAPAPLDRVYSMERLMNWLEWVVSKYLNAEVDGSLYYGKYWYPSSKYTISMEEGRVVVSHYFVYPPFPGYEESLERKVVYAFNSTMHLENVSLYGFSSDTLSEEVMGELRKTVDQNFFTIFHQIRFAWKEIDKQVGVDSEYLEVVLGATEIVMNGQNVRPRCFDGIWVGEMLSSGAVYSPCIATAVISPENGFTMDESASLHGKHAVCVAY